MALCALVKVRQRKAGETLKIVQAQLRGSLPAAIKNTVIVYELCGPSDQD